MALKKDKKWKRKHARRILQMAQTELVRKDREIEKLKRTTKRQPHPFYDSGAWQDLRYKAIKHYGRACMACKASDVELHVDHIKPRSKFPELELDFNNLQVLCRPCNMGKGARDETDWRYR